MVVVCGALSNRRAYRDRDAPRVVSVVVLVVGGVDGALAARGLEGLGVVRELVEEGVSARCERAGGLVDDEVEGVALGVEARAASKKREANAELVRKVSGRTTGGLGWYL